MCQTPNNAPLLGLVSISFRSKTVEEIAAATSAAGLSCVEWGSDIHAPYHDPVKLQKICALQKQYGLHCCSYGTYFTLGETPLSELNGYLKAAQTLGTNVVRLWCGTKSTSKYTKEETNALFALCREAAAMAESQGMILGLECHPDTFTEDCEGALAVMKAVDSKAFRMYWQPNQYKSLESNLAYIAAIAPYTLRIHTFNWEGAEKHPLSEGIATWKEYLKGFSPVPPLLLEFMPDDRIESLVEEATALKEIVL